MLSSTFIGFSSNASVGHLNNKAPWSLQAASGSLKIEKTSPGKLVALYDYDMNIMSQKIIF